MKISDEKLAKMANFFKDYSSITVSTTDDEPVVITVAKYKYGNNTVTSAQVNFLKSLVNYQSTSNLMKMNKFATSTIINFAKRCNNFYPYVVVK